MGLSDIYVKAFIGIFGVYAVQMLLIPGNMVTDHWDMPSTPAMEFWIRGHAVSMFACCYLLTLVPNAVAAKVSLFISTGIGVLYPFNAKFGYLTPGLPLKYPMHYVPELLMTGLIAGGLLAVMDSGKGKKA